MTLGIAIPTYIGHIKYLNNLLNAISKSTVLPQQVSVSISSFDGELDLSTYPFELIISKTLDYKNPSQNRNIAAGKLRTDVISFIDGDDLPHNKRNEYIMTCFKNGSKIVAHDYERMYNDSEIFNNDIGEIEFLPNYINKFISDLQAPENEFNHLGYHNAHITLLNEIYKNFKYDESKNIEYREDSEFNSRLVKNGFKICYIKNKLSLYRQ